MKERIEEIFENIKKITSAKDYVFGEEITVMAASKTQSEERILQARSYGITHFGENRMQEWREKKHLPFKFDFIGALQANKLKYLVGEVEMIQSISSEKLLLECERIAEKKGVTQKILLEVNIGCEEQKSGISKEEVAKIAQLASQQKHIELCGLMTVLPKLENQNGDNLYLQMRKIYQEEKEKHPQITILSMGMSEDYQDAIKYGSNMVRIGSALFGAR